MKKYFTFLPNGHFKQLVNSITNKLRKFFPVIFCLFSIAASAQPRFIAFNFFQVSRISGSASNLPKQTVENNPLCFTAIGIGNEIYYGADASLITALIGELAGKNKGTKPNANGSTGYDGGFLSFYAGKQLTTKDKYTFGAGIDCDMRGLGFSYQDTIAGNPSGIKNGMYTIGPSVCLQYRLNKILTFVSVFGAGIGTGFEFQWRNSVSVGLGKFGFNIQPDFNYYVKKDASIADVNWKIHSRFLRFGISFRLD